MTGLNMKYNTKELLMQLATVLLLLPILIYPVARTSGILNLAVICVLGCLFLLFVCLRGVISITKISIVWLVTLFPVLFNSYSLKAGEYGYILMWIAMLLFVTLGAKKTHKWIKTALWIIAILTCIYAFSTILFNLHLDLGLSQLASVFRNGKAIEQGDIFTAGLTAHYSHNGMYIATGVVAWFGISIYSKKRLHYAITGAFVLALILTQKRGPLIAVVIAISLTYFIVNFGNLKKKAAIIFLSAIIVFFVVYLIASLAPSTFSVFDRFFGDSGLSNREYLWDYAIKLFKNNFILGAGWGYFPNNVKITVDTLEVTSVHAHNIYLELLAETGIVGFIWYIISFAFTLASSVKMIRYISKNNLTKTISYAPMIFSIGYQIFFLVYGFSGNPLYDYQMFIPYMICVAFVVYYTANIKKIMSKINKDKIDKEVL